MIVKAEAIVLKSMKYGETSRIVTMYTREFGKVSLMAKGARAPKNKFGAALDAMSHCDIVFYRKEQRDLHLLSQADVIQPYRGIVNDPLRLMTGFAILEFLHASVQGEEEHAALFDVLSDTLDALDSAATQPFHVLLRYLLQLAVALGIGTDFEHCVHCRAALDDTRRRRSTMQFSIAHGGCTCDDCAPRSDATAIDTSTAEVLLRLQRGERIAEQSSTRARREALHLLHRHLRAHIDGMRTVRSLHMLEAFD
jgi:DNA repair protein RecO (recombination protein O)